MAPTMIALPAVATAVLLLGTTFLLSTASALLVTSSHTRVRHRRVHRFSDPTPFYRPISVLYTTSRNDDEATERDGNDSQGDEAMSLDQQKLALENMLKSSDNQAEDTPNKNISILTTSRKQRLEREIQLLKQLDPEHPSNNAGHSDLQNQELVVSELWSLWYGERGALNQKKLQDVEQMLNDPSLWAKAEKEYLTLIREHCSTDGTYDNLDLSRWVEPANRLATLLYLMGRLKESKKWCERILLAKPWHIGALSGIVMVCMKMGDKEGVMKYSVMGMPNLSDQMRKLRKEWVQQNVKVAEANLLRLEQLNKEAFGEPDKDVSDRSPAVVDTDQTEDELEDTDDSAWQ